MAVSSPNLTIDLYKNDSCTALLLADITGIVGVNGNVDGYGPDTVLVNDVTGVIITLLYNSLQTPVTYTFTIANGVITACTLSISGGTPANIFAQLTSTVWPFAATLPFDLFGDYNVNTPTFQDDVYSATYVISGTHNAEAFEFTAVKNKAVTCNAQYCIDQKFTELDWDCECSTDASKEALLGQALINQVHASVVLGDLSTSLASLSKVQSLCNTTTGGCGCS